MVEIGSIAERIEALKNHAAYLGNLIEGRVEGQEDIPVGTVLYRLLLDQKTKTENLLLHTESVVACPLGHWVQITKKHRSLEIGDVVYVNYVYKTRSTAHGTVPGREGRVTIRTGRVEVIDLDPLPGWILAPGMRVQFGLSSEWVIQELGIDNIRVKDRLGFSQWIGSSQWKPRVGIVAIQGRPVLTGGVISDAGD